jgi:hypothetical protein
MSGPPAAIASPVGLRHRDIIGHTQTLARHVDRWSRWHSARVVDYEALAAKLTREELSGAILDVFDPEPLPADSPLWTTPHLLISPHVSSDDVVQYVPRTLDLIFENVRRLLAGRPLKNRVSPEREY